MTTPLLIRAAEIIEGAIYPPIFYSVAEGKEMLDIARQLREMHSGDSLSVARDEALRGAWIACRQLRSRSYQQRLGIEERDCVIAECEDAIKKLQENPNDTNQ